MIRATAPILGTLMLTAVTIALAAAVSTTVLTAPLAPLGPTDPTPIALSLIATADDDRLVFVHEQGPSLDVRELTVRIAVDGTPLSHQPPVPFFSVTGFQAAPTGPFNPASDPVWETGERTSLQLAGTNTPQLTTGAMVTVRFYVDDTPIAVVEAPVQ